ncbi:glycoside hydrolase family 99-like domain-containing protein [Alishewanella tabrizica]|uniref:Glycosyltransferase n=1 Tax=Alishewanella tabrizica TaxID=671278 RepID=A0ABQ2WCC7_9ALTE|nr:glycoside hydrolase family 99-like domain-containing protein [Alishewanella tabrizica]GGW48461.1 hypothetical protein GCM10008111_00080 [Alishewanella tabrizica]
MSDYLVVKANKALNNKNYTAAVNYYLDAAVAVPVLQDSLKFNMRFIAKQAGLPQALPLIEKLYDQQAVAELKALFQNTTCPELPEQSLDIPSFTAQANIHNSIEQSNVLEHANAERPAQLIQNSNLILNKPENLDDYFFEKIQESKTFDLTFYIKHYQSFIPDGENPLAYYLNTGIKLGHNPSENFNTEHYLKCNPDVAAAGINPYIHYVCNGINEGREAVPKPYKSRYEVAPVEYVPRVSNDVSPVTKAVRTICFYLPQFHAIPENDKWWGKGFTEWTNVKPAIPRFEGHYQPHVPHADIGYYNLLERDAQAKQIELAKQYGIEGFCYYLYWFSGQRLLEQPLDKMLADPTLDFPFCVCWANENWSRRWDGLENDLLMIQNYSPEDDLAFIANISKYLRDERYIRVNGKPLLLVYRPNLFPDMKATTKRWRDWCRKNGIGEIYLAYPQSFETVDPAAYDFDAAIEFPPNNSKPPRITDEQKAVVDDFQTTVYDWRIFVERSDEYIDPGYKLFRSATPSWDNTARKKNKGTVFHNSCPKLFERYLTNAFKETLLKRENPDERFVFINAWNEWAEGAHLEPDERYGYAWLQAVRNAHETVNTEKKSILIVSHDAHPHGAQILCLNFAKYFAEQLHFDVQMIVLGEGVMLDKYRRYATVQQLNLQFATAAEITNTINKVKAAGVTAALVNTTVSGLFVPHLKQAGITVVSLIHELPSILQGYKLQQHATAIAQYADKIVFPAKQVQQGFEGFINKELTQAVIKPQGVYLPSLLRQGADKIAVRNEVRANLGLAPNAKIIMCAGYADHRKGFDYFVQACSNLIAKDPTIYALWVGHLDKPFVDASMQNAIQAGTERHFIFTGLVEDPRKYYIAADVYALTSREDPFPSVVMEALDALTPVVAFKDCGGFENLLQRDCGLLVPKDNVAAYAEAMSSLLQNPQQAAKLAQTGQHIVQTELSFYHYLFDLLDYAKQPLPRVSVAVPNYNYAKYIVSRLDSIVKQTFPLYELIVLDDVSSDNSVEVITEYLQSCQIPYRLVVNEQNSGSVFKQWQKGAELAKGEYLWIAEADDLAEPKFVETLIKFFADPEVVLAYSQSKQIDQDGNLLANDYLAYTDDIGDYWREDYVISGEEEIKRALCIKNTIPNVSSVLLKRDVFCSVLVNNKDKINSFKVAGDWFIYSKVIFESKIAFCSESFNKHRRHLNSVTKSSNHLNEIVFIQNSLATSCKIGNDEVVAEKISRWNSHLVDYFG